jgi:DNA-binding response OmpR family regulator
VENLFNTLKRLKMNIILIIEDDEQVRKYLAKILKLQGYEVIQATNGRVGLELYRNAPVDLIITDIIMPEKEGLETIRELKYIKKDVKIIAISGGWSQMEADNLLRMAQSFGADYVLKKPFKNQELIHIVKSLLSSD